MRLPRLPNLCAQRRCSNCLLPILVCSVTYIICFLIFMAVLLRPIYFSRSSRMTLKEKEKRSEDTQHIKHQVEGREEAPQDVKMDSAPKYIEDDEFSDMNDPLKHITDTSTYIGHGSHDFAFPLVVDMPKLVSKKLRGEEVTLKPLNHVNFPWISEHKAACTKDIEIVVLIKTFYTNKENRKQIRATWGDSRCWRKPTLIFFLMGSSNPYVDKTPGGKKKIKFKDNKKEILEEAEEFNDILLADYSDHYYNNTLKFMTGVSWISTFCQHAKYIIFADDDYFVHPYQVTRYLDSVSPSVFQRFIAGYVWRYSLPRRRHKKRKSKWDVTFQEYPWPSYPPYIAAGFILMSSPVLQQINVAMRYTRYFRFDDVFLGLLLHKLLMVPLHVDAVHSYMPFNPHSNQTADLMVIMASHGYRKPQDLDFLWKRLQLKLLCSNTET